MKVYCVLGGYAYEGSDDDSLRVFFTLEDAEEYTRELSDYDSFSILEREVC